VTVDCEARALGRDDTFTLNYAGLAALEALLGRSPLSGAREEQIGPEGHRAFILAVDADETQRLAAEARAAAQLEDRTLAARLSTGPEKVAPYGDAIPRLIAMLGEWGEVERRRPDPGATRRFVLAFAAFCERCSDEGFEAWP
jgi:hypothetical protein